MYILSKTFVFVLVLLNRKSGNVQNNPKSPQGLYLHVLMASYGLAPRDI